MFIKPDKNAERQKRHKRIRLAMKGTAEIPRMNVYRSLSNIYVQIIDDARGVTLASASTLEKAVAADVKGKTKKEAARFIGQRAAKKALEQGVGTVVFDRGGYLYTGRVKELADGAREAGLKF
ncbi:MAG: 50S ribosomal protein L18 [Clostridiales bacterium]|jgi:large subunit ribosomal protein L18|nr:50S ribosomal protein L18 [Clostridiales bacterium]